MKITIKTVKGQQIPVEVAEDIKLIDLKAKLEQEN